MSGPVRKGRNPISFKLPSLRTIRARTYRAPHPGIVPKLDERVILNWIRFMM
jgi:hypothetical protein